MAKVAICDAIFADLTAGTPLRRSLEAHRINTRDFYREINANEATAQRYALAKAAGIDAIADDALHIADDPDIEPNDKRIRVDTRKWLLSKLAPKKYGEQLALQHSGAVDFGGVIERLNEGLKRAGKR